jgi:CDP-diacylglycerol--glycerol-3-phosphate 3-phosphatidyltransferase
MNLPNKLTIIRFVLSPILLALILLNIPHNYVFALIVFVVGCITDFLDGNIARKNKLVTDFGKFLDPIADKMLTQAAFFGLLAQGIGYGIVWINFIIILREFCITSMRLLAAKDGNVIAANLWGKAKTVAQMVAIIVVFVAQEAAFLFGKVYPATQLTIEIICTAVLWISTILTVVSGINYLYLNKQYLNYKK